MTASDAENLPLSRRVFANRTLNMRAIKAVGCDMDYTLIHYRHELWEERAYEHVAGRLAQAGWPVAGLAFDADFATRGLIVDLELGNLVKASRFGYVTRAYHGTTPMNHDAQRRVYSRVLVDLSEPRWVILNTLCTLSEACLYAQLVDLLDDGAIKHPVGYRELYEAVRQGVNAAHVEGALKAEIMREPDRFVELDPELPLTLLDLKHSGKALMLITNSEWSYTQPMMSYAFDRYLDRGRTWRDLFDLVIVAARKPAFFKETPPFLEVVGDAGLLRPGTGELTPASVYYGGNARAVEKHLGVPGEEILYIGDHVYADVHVTKEVLRWRTALIVRELESEIEATQAFADQQSELRRLMAEKSRLEHEHATSRLSLQRRDGSYVPDHYESEIDPSPRTPIRELRAELEALDARIAELARRASELGNQRWGLLLRAGNDKSRMARQLERYADVYTSRVSNFLRCTPYAYLRAPAGSLPHDPE